MILLLVDPFLSRSIGTSLRHRDLLDSCPRKCEQPCQTCFAEGFADGAFAAASGYPHPMGRGWYPSSRSIAVTRTCGVVGA
jgi:hypothetical protein